MATLASVVLGVVFLVAGGSKIASGPAWPEQARSLGAPALVVPVLPWFEIGLGALLIVRTPGTVAVVAALVLLGAFTGLLVVRLVQGRHPPCACFGAWSATPLGWGHVVRNVAFMALGVVALVA